MRAEVLIFMGAFLFWISARGEDSSAVLLHAASWYPGAGNFYVEGAVVVAVTPCASGGAEVEFQAKKWGPVEESGYEGLTEEHPIQTVVWEWPEGVGPVPVLKGMCVDLVVSPSSEILRVSYMLDEFGAQRRMDDGRWEFIVVPMADCPWKGTRAPKKRIVFLRVLPRAFQDLPTELRWTKSYGLLIANFEDGQYGAGPEEELESATMRKVGWPISNQPGTRVLPGRDGWQRWFGYFGQSTKGESNPHWLAREVPISQRLPALVRP